MKKLIIGAVVALAAVSSQAASIAWTSNSMSLTDANGVAITSLDSGSLVLVVMSAADAWSSASAITTASGTVSETTTMGISTKTSTKGRVTGTVTFAYDSSSSDNLINNGNYLALMFQDGSGLHQLKYTSGDNSGELVAAAWQVSGLSDNSSKLTAKAIPMTGNFTAVPEPTSAMLMLFGVAGLALRRRRA